MFVERIVVSIDELARSWATRDNSVHALSFHMIQNLAVGCHEMTTVLPTNNLGGSRSGIDFPWAVMYGIYKVVNCSLLYSGLFAFIHIQSTSILVLLADVDLIWLNIFAFYWVKLTYVNPYYCNGTVKIKHACRVCGNGHIGGTRVLLWNPT